MEAPEKIYLERILYSNGVYDNWKSQKTISDDIEYIRTDTFIEKTEKFLKSYRRETPDKTGYIPGIVDDKMIEDFRNYLKGE